MKRILTAASMVAFLGCGGGTEPAATGQVAYELDPSTCVGDGVVATAVDGANPNAFSMTPGYQTSPIVVPSGNHGLRAATDLHLWQTTAKIPANQTYTLNLLCNDIKYTSAIGTYALASVNSHGLPAYWNSYTTTSGIAYNLYLTGGSLTINSDKSYTFSYDYNAYYSDGTYWTSGSNTYTGTFAQSGPSFSLTFTGESAVHTGVLSNNGFLASFGVPVLFTR